MICPVCKILCKYLHKAGGHHANKFEGVGIQAEIALHLILAVNTQRARKDCCWTEIWGRNVIDDVRPTPDVERRGIKPKADVNTVCADTNCGTKAGIFDGPEVFEEHLFRIVKYVVKPPRPNIQ